MTATGDLDTIGGRIRWLIEDYIPRREGRRISHSEFARRIRVRPQQLSRWINDPDRPPGEDSIKLIADAAGVSPAWLRYGPPNPLHEADEMGEAEQYEGAGSKRVRERPVSAYGGARESDRFDVDRRLSEIIGSTDMDVNEKSMLLLDLALALRADALRAHARAALIDAEEAARRREELAAAVRGAPPIPGQRTPVPRPSDESGRGRAAG